MTQAATIRVAEREPTNWLVSLLLVAFAVLLPRFTDSAKTPYALLCLSALCYVLLNRREFVKTSRGERFLFACLLANFGWIAFCFYLNGEPGHGDSLLWGRHFYLLFLVPMFFLFRRYRVPNRVIVLALCASAGLTFGDMLVDLALGLDHRLQGMNPNALGPIQLAMTSILLLCFLVEKRGKWRWLAAAGALLALTNVVLSQSRGTWMTLLVLCFGLCIYLIHRLSWRQGLAMSAGLGLLLVGSYTLPMVETRIDQGLENISAYFASENYRDSSRSSSFGIRMELWRTGWRIFLENPVTGVGVGGFKLMAREHAERYRVNPVVQRYRYVHNQYLAALATRGLPGLLLLLAVLLAPPWLAWRSLAESGVVEVAPLAVILVSGIYIVGNLVEDHFEAKSATMFFSVMLSLFLARCSPFSQPPECNPDAA